MNTERQECINQIVTDTNNMLGAYGMNQTIKLHEIESHPKSMEGVRYDYWAYFTYNKRFDQFLYGSAYVVYIQRDEMRNQYVLTVTTGSLQNLEKIVHGCFKDIAEKLYKEIA